MKRKRKCCVPNCGSSFGDVPLHSFPKGELALTWLEKIKYHKLYEILPWALCEYDVCDKHFESKFKVCDEKISNDAFPTLFTNSEICQGVPNAEKFKCSTLKCYGSNKQNFNGRKCEICGIKDSSGSEQNGIYMAKFPLDEKLCKEWVNIAGRKDLANFSAETLHHSKYICITHFNSDDFDKDGNLLEDAVPGLKLTRLTLDEQKHTKFPVKLPVKLPTKLPATNVGKIKAEKHEPSVESNNYEKYDDSHLETHDTMDGIDTYEDPPSPEVAEDVPLCVLCLRGNRDLKPIEESLADLYNEWPKHKVTEDMLLYCSECETTLKKCYNFKRKCIEASRLLIIWGQCSIGDRPPKSFLYEQLGPPKLGVWKRNNIGMYYHNNDPNATTNNEKFEFQITKTENDEIKSMVMVTNTNPSIENTEDSKPVVMKPEAATTESNKETVSNESDSATNTDSSDDESVVMTENTPKATETSPVKKLTLSSYPIKTNSPVIDMTANIPDIIKKLMVLKTTQINNTGTTLDDSPIGKPNSVLLADSVKAYVAKRSMPDNFVVGSQNKSNENTSDNTNLSRNNDSNNMLLTKTYFNKSVYRYTGFENIKSENRREVLLDHSYTNNTIIQPKEINETVDSKDVFSKTENYSIGDEGSSLIFDATPSLDENEVTTDPLEINPPSTNKDPAISTVIDHVKNIASNAKQDNKKVRVILKVKKPGASGSVIKGMVLMGKQELRNYKSNVTIRKNFKERIQNILKLRGRVKTKSKEVQIKTESPEKTKKPEERQIVTYESIKDNHVIVKEVVKIMPDTRKSYRNKYSDFKLKMLEPKLDITAETKEVSPSIKEVSSDTKSKEANENDTKIENDNDVNEDGNDIDSNDEQETGSDDSEDDMIPEKIQRIKIKYRLKKIFKKYPVIPVTADGYQVYKTFMLCFFENMSDEDMRQLRNVMSRVQLKKGVFPKLLLDLLSKLQKKYEKEFTSVFDIICLENKEEVLREFENRRYYPEFEDSEYKCFICLTPFKYRKSYKIHMQLHSPSYGNFECDICHVRKKRKNRMASHRQTHTVVFKCKKCPMVTSKKYDMLQHTQQHQGYKFICHVCGKTYMTAKAYKNHKYKQHNKFLCEFCADGFYSSATLDMHKQIKHEGMDLSQSEDRTQCEQCNVVFYSANVCMKHRVRAHGEKGIPRFRFQQQSSSRRQTRKNNEDQTSKAIVKKFCAERTIDASGKIVFTVKQTLGDSGKPVKCDENVVDTVQTTYYVVGQAKPSQKVQRPDQADDMDQTEHTTDQADEMGQTDEMDQTEHATDQTEHTTDQADEMDQSEYAVDNTNDVVYLDYIDAYHTDVIVYQTDDNVDQTVEIMDQSYNEEPSADKYKILEDAAFKDDINVISKSPKKTVNTRKFADYSGHMSQIVDNVDQTVEVVDQSYNEEPPSVCKRPIIDQAFRDSINVISKRSKKTDHRKAIYSEHKSDKKYYKLQQEAPKKHGNMIRYRSDFTSYLDQALDRYNAIHDMPDLD